MADGTTTIDDLQIEIGAKAQTANDAIDRLVTKLDRLQTSLSKVNGSQLTGLANGVQKLGNSMQVMNTIKTADFTRLATNLTKLGNINVSALNSSAISLSQLSRAFGTLSTATQNTQSIVNMTNALSKLGGASVQRAITNIPLLANAMNNLMVTLSRSPRVSNNVIQLTNALANLASQGARVGTASNSIETGLNRTNRSTTRASRGFGGLASAIGKFYATYFLVIRGIKGLYKSIESTADYLEAFNYFNVALGKIGSDWSHQFEQYGYESAEAYADSFSTRLQSSLKNLSGLQITLDTNGNGLLTETGLKNLGLNIQEITQYASQLASVTNSVGQVGEVSLAAANSLTKLGADLSSLFNLDYSSVMQNLQSGLIGQSRALYKYGIDITNATLQTYAYELGLEKAVSEMTQAEKMQLRLIAILDQSKVSWGDLANTINSPSNMIRQFSNNLKEVGMVLGQLFIPLMQKVMPVINGMTIALKRLLVNIAGFLGIQLDLSSFGQGYSGLGEDIDGVTDAFDDATKSANKFKTVTLGIDELSINAPQDTSGTSTGVSGGIDLTYEILKATEEYEKVWNNAFKNMENKAQEWADRIEKIFEPITKPLQSLFKNISIGDWFSAGKDTSDIVSGIFDLFSNAIKKVDWKKIGTNIGNFLKGIDWEDIIDSVGNFLETALNAAMDLLEGAFDADPIATTIVTALGIAKFTGLEKILEDKIIKSVPKSITLTEAIAISIPFTVFLKTRTEEGAEKYKSSLDKLTSSNFKEMTATDWFNNLLAFANVTISGDTGQYWANQTLIPKIEDYENLEEYKKALEEFEKEKYKISGIEYDENGWNKTIVDFGDWWNNKVAPWFSIAKWYKLGQDAINGLIWGIEGKSLVLAEASQSSGEGMIKGLNTALRLGNPEVEKQSNSIVGSVLSIFDSAKNDFFNNGKISIEKYSKALELGQQPLVFKSKSIANSTITPFNNMQSDFSIAGGNAINEMASSMESSANSLYAKCRTIVSNINNILGGATAGITMGLNAVISQVNIPAYAVGGFPEDGLFMANHNELVGQFTNGRTAVANNEQIVSGIKEGVREAVSEILAPYLADIAKNTRETADKDLSVNIGDRDIARANARGQRSLGYSLIT